MVRSLEKVKKRMDKLYPPEKLTEDVISAVQSGEIERKIADAFLKAWKEVCGDYILLFRGIKLTPAGEEYRLYKFSKYYPWTLDPLVAFHFARTQEIGSVKHKLFPAIRVVKAKVGNISPDMIETVPFYVSLDTETNTYKLEIEYNEAELGFKSKIPPYEDYRILKPGYRTTGELPKGEDVFDLLKGLFGLLAPKRFHGLIRILVWVKDRRFPTGGYWAFRWVKPGEYYKMKLRREKVLRHPLSPSEEAMLASSKQRLGEFRMEDYTKEGIPADRAPDWYLNNFSPKEAKAWQSAGFDPYHAYDWRAEGYTPEEAERWYHAFGFVEVANRWRPLGFSPEEAKKWDKAGVKPEVALLWKKEGYRPEDVPKMRRKIPIQRKFWFAD